MKYCTSTLIQQAQNNKRSLIIIKQLVVNTYDSTLLSKYTCTILVLYIRGSDIDFSIIDIIPICVCHSFECIYKQNYCYIIFNLYHNTLLYDKILIINTNATAVPLLLQLTVYRHLVTNCFATLLLGSSLLFCWNSTRCSQHSLCKYLLLCC